MTTADGVGVYVHIPFCSHRCDYCAFATWTDRAHVADRYVDAVVAHARVVHDGAVPALDGTWVGAGLATPTRPATSVFFGGGTPNLLPAADLMRILAAIPRTAGAEVTVECNPEAVTAPLLDAYLEGGVTRISLGVQSFDEDVLRALGRRHDGPGVRAAAALVRERPFASWNVDLIYGGVGESVSSWRRTVTEAVGLGVPHVSAYGLTVEAGTPLAAEPHRHPDDDDLAAKYDVVDDVLRAAGLDWYEISNWSRPGHACRHNELYWRQGDYVALGCAAHGHRGGHRWWNLRTPERYVDALESGRDPVASGEHLDREVRVDERLQLELRTRRGVARRHLTADALAAMPEGLVVAEGDRYVLTRAGRLLANEISLRLTP